MLVFQEHSSYFCTTWFRIISSQKQSVGGSLFSSRHGVYQLAPSFTFHIEVTILFSFCLSVCTPALTPCTVIQSIRNLVPLATNIRTRCKELLVYVLYSTWYLYRTLRHSYYEATCCGVFIQQIISPNYSVNYCISCIVTNI